MGLFSRSSESKQAQAEYESAVNDLDRVSRRDRAETPAWTAANRRVAEAEQNVSTWYRN